MKWHVAFHMHRDIALNRCECMTWFLNKFIGGLSNKKIFVRVCPLTIIGGLANKIFVGVCPLNYIGGLSTQYLSEYAHKLYRRVDQINFDIRDCPMSF